MKSNPAEIEKGVPAAVHKQPGSKLVSIEDALGENDDSLKTIFDNVNAVIVRLNKYGKIIEINSKVEQFFGCKREEVLEKYITSLGILSAKELPKMFKMFAEIVRGKRTCYQGELEVRDKAGNKKYIDVNCTVVRKNRKLDSTVSVIYDITERKKAEEALRMSEHKYAGLVEHGNDGILIIQDHLIKYINSKLLEMFGYPYEDIIGKQFINVIAEEDREKVIARSRKRQAGEEVPPKYEFDIINKSGKRISVEVNASLMEFEGRPADMAIIRDITDRKKTEEALRTSEETFSKVFHASPNPICIVSFKGETIIDINENYIRFTGYTREETIGRSAAELGLWVNQDDLKTIRNILKQKSRMYNHQFASRMKSGEIRTGLFSAEIVNISGKLCVVLVITDITEQKWAEDALKESEEFTSSLLMNTPNPIFVAYPDSTIKYVNPAFEKLTGFSLTDIIGIKAPYPWWPEETRNEISTTLKETIFGYGIKKEMTYRKKNGERFWVEINATRINKNGERQYLLINWVDITERQQMEEALRFSDAAFKSIRESIVAVDNNRVVTYWNNVSEQLFCIPSSEAIGKKLKDVIMPVDEYPGQSEERIKRIGSQGYSRNELRYTTPRGEIWVDTTIQVMKKGEEDYGHILTTQDITARKQAEKNIHDSEEKFSRAFSSASDAMAICSSNGGKFLEVNNSYVKLSGYSREELIGRNADELNMWGRLEDRKKILHTTVKKGRVVQEEFAFLTKPGEIRTCLFSSETINVSGERRMIIVVQDITERKKMETALRESEEKFSKAFTVSANAICISSLKDGRHIEANESFTRFTGYLREEVVGHQGGELDVWVNPEEKKLWTDTLEKEGKVLNQEFSSRMKSGEIRIGLGSADAINIGGEPYRMVVITDITERKKIEEDLRDSEEKFSKAFNASGNAICITSLKTNKFLEVNKSYSRFTGYTRDEVIGRTAEELGLWVNDEQLKRMHAKITKEGCFHNIEFNSRMKSGEIRVGLGSAENIYIGGEPCRIAVIADITERKQAEEALRDSEEKFSKAFSASANSICITSLSDNKLIDVNESYSRFTGYTREEVIGRTAIELGLWADKAEMGKFRSLIEKDGRFHNLEIHTRMKSGEISVGLASAEIINIGGKQCRILAITDITERKKAEEALRESEAKFSKAFLASPGAIAIATVKDGRFIDVNDSFFYVMGYTRAEAIGHTSKELNIFTDDDSREKLVDDLNREAHAHNKMVRFRRKSGEIGYGLFSAEKIIINNEPCIISVNMDVTEQKKAEESLRLLGSVTQQVTDSIIVTDPEFKITYMNNAAQDLFGYSIDEALGADIGLFDAETVSRKVRQDIRTALSMGKTWTAVLTKRRKDGSIFLCDCRRSPLFDETGRLTSNIVVYRDITEQKEIEAKLKAHKQLIESILTSMPEGVLVTDSSDMVVLANESFRRIFHTGRKIIENKPLNETMRVEQLIDLYQAMKKGNADNNSLEFRYKVKNQEKIIACVIIKMEGGRMLLTFTDVSREREEEDKLYLMDRLASLGEMAAGLAHELNNPLTGILTLSQLLVNTDMPEEQKEDLQCVYSEAKRAASIVKNVLLFTRNNSYENGQSSVNEVVKEVLRLREHEEKTSNISVVTNLQEQLPEIPLDKYQLQQVFLNIILNAEAAMKETGRPGTLTVTTERVNNHVNIMFSDTGCGIKKDVLPRIFDPFFTTKDIGKGTGLGLSICYGIIVKHAGKISVKTQVGKGTTFTIRMPVANEK